MSKQTWTRPGSDRRQKLMMLALTARRAGAMLRARGTAGPSASGKALDLGDVLALLPLAAVLLSELAAALPVGLSHVWRAAVLGMQPAVDQLRGVRDPG